MRNSCIILITDRVKEERKCPHLPTSSPLASGEEETLNFIETKLPSPSQWRRIEPAYR